MTALTVAILVPNEAVGQTTSPSFAELRRRLDPDDTVIVKSADGASVGGTVRSLSETTLILQHGHETLSLRAEDVERITKHHHPHGHVDAFPKHSSMRSAARLNMKPGW